MDTITSWLGKIRSFLPVPLQIATAPFSETAKVMDPESEDYQKWADQLPATQKPVGWQEKGLEVPQISPDDLLPSKLPAKLTPLIGGMFIGRKAKTWDYGAAAEALKRAYEGIDTPKEIYNATRVFTEHPDRAMRQEIADAGALLKSTAMKQNPIDYLRVDIPETTVGNLLNHPDLFKAYPKLQDIKVKGAYKAGAREAGLFDAYTNYIKVQGSSTENIKSALLHELQHAIQYEEGWAKGGTPAWVKNNSELSAFFDSTVNNYLKKGLPQKDAEEKASIELYQRLAGESEAVATQNRRKLTTEELAKIYPADSYPFSLDKLLLRK